MAFTDDIALNGNTHTTPNTSEGELTYSWVSTIPGGIQRDVSSLANTTPQSLVISHQKVVRNGINRRRSRVGINAHADDSDLGNVPYGAYFVVDAPIGTAVTTDNVKAAIGRLIALLTVSGNVEKLLNGEP
jgi:hypothetical protein